MIQSFTFKSILLYFVQVEIFQFATSSFVSWPCPIYDEKPQTRSNFGCCSGTGANAGFRIYHPRPCPFIARIARTDPKTRISTSDTPAQYGNNTAPSVVNNNINGPVEIPIIGPLIDIQKPIIVGDSIWLDPPTPLQWKAVEASVSAQHGGTIMNWKASTASEINEMVADKINLATVSKSPLVAVLHRGGKEYATIAAVEGIVTKSESRIDTSDAESFRESLASSCSAYYSDSSKLRLMAIGRAKLSHFTTKFLMDESFTATGRGYEFDQMKDTESGSVNPTDSEPLLVARMELLLDSNGKGETASSPVHALNRLSTFAQRVRFLQEDRQRIVRGLQAAQSRLEMAMYDWEDWDGIGEISNGFDRQPSPKGSKSMLVDEDDQSSSMLDKFLEEYNTAQNIPSTPSTPSHSLPLSPGAARCIDLDNYGLGTTSSAFVSLISMSDILTENLKNYFSPTRLQSEEFEYEVFSWCALQSLQPYLSSEEIYEALFNCINTCERLELIYHYMIKHKMDLNELAQAKSMELRSCGEECDLF